MFPFLKNHPFPVEAFFESSTVLSFALPKEELEHLIPPCLELDTFLDRYAFIAVAMVKTSGLRPKGFPHFLGNDFFLVGYRIFVKYNTLAGKRLRGLYILKSETDKRKMEILGNIFTHYNYSTTDIEQIQWENKKEIRSSQSDFRITIDSSIETASLPAGSPFSDWKEARRFAGPLPFTFSFDPHKKTVLIIEGVRQNWTPKPIQITDYHFSFLKSMNWEKAVLANAFTIENIPYYWKKGKMEIWNG